MSCFIRELPKFSDKQGSDRKVWCINLLRGLPIVGEYNIQYGFLIVAAHRRLVLTGLTFAEVGVCDIVHQRFFEI